MSTADAWQSSGVSSAVPSSCFPLASLQRAPRVERVAQAIADVVDGEHRQKDHPSWEQGPMGRNMHITPCGRTFQSQPRYQGPARWAVEAYVPHLITSPSS